MGYRSQSGSRHGFRQKNVKVQHKKAKAKAEKRRSSGKYFEEETSLVTAEQIAEKTVSSLNRLGSQLFAISPFSEYFEDWLVTLREVLAEFESNAVIGVDEQFVSERLQIVTDTERELAERKNKEAILEEAEKALMENKQVLAQLDEECATKTRENRLKRNAEIERLTRNVHNLEEELNKIGQMKTSFFGFTKKAKAKKEAETTQKLDSAKTELNSTIQNLSTEQEKINAEYEKQKQTINEKVQAVKKDAEKLEVDSSLAVRQAACNALANAVNACLKRKAASPQESTQ